jgi:tetratricopeptide (TPR) repeat protein
MPGQGTSETQRSQPRVVSLSAIAIGLWVMLVVGLAYVWLRPIRPHSAEAHAVTSAPAAAHTPVAHQTPAVTVATRDQALALMVSQRITDLGIKPKTVRLPTDLSLEEALTIKQGDYEHADRIAKDVLAHSTLQRWRFYPFNDFMKNIVRYEDPILLHRLNDWIAHDPHSAIAHLIRGVYYDKLSWITRGGDHPSEVPDDRMRSIQQDIAKASGDFRTAIDLDPKVPWSYYELLQVVSAGGNSAGAEQVFKAAVKAFPGYYPLYRERLDELSPKWYGSISAMYDFTDLYAGRAPSNSPLRLLYLQLYVNLLETAGASCDSLQGDAKQSCVASVIDRMTRPDLLPGMLQALKLYGTSDPVEFSTAAWPLLSEMACNRCYGSPSAVAGVLQAAASIMGSDTRMMDTPTHNSYMLDDITARVWGQIGNTSNADQKFREALKDVEQTSFPDEVQKAVALATIFDHMVQFADDTSQFIDMIAYLEAENEVGGSNFSSAPFGTCYAYYRMKYFSEAVKECSTLIDGNGNYLVSHYWRGKAYEGLRQWDASIADFSPVADSADNWFRVGAALDMSYDFGQKGDFAGQLASMSQHAYLFDPKLQPASDLAVAYNNRCFAHMQLGQLQEALDDCTTSLKYGRIPDALHKEQELLKRLGSHAKPSPEPVQTPGKPVSTQSM